MRFGDLVSLPLEALWQQKSRTVLTTLGVVFGSFVLAASLSIGQGVQQTINNISRRSDLLRMIAVSSHWRPTESKVEKTPVAGKMSDAKRQRIRRALAEHQARTNRQDAREPLRRKQLDTLAAMEHVEAAVPVLFHSGYAVLDGHEEFVNIDAIRPADPACQKRLVAGRLFHGADERAVVVNEFLLYQCGLIEDDDVARALGRKLRLEFRRQWHKPGLLVHLIKSQGAISRDEQRALDKISENLPGMLDRFGLSAAQIEILQGAIGQEPRRNLVYGVELPIVGVVRVPGDEDRKSLWDPLAADGGCMLPVETAMNLADGALGPANWEIGQIVVLVDDENETRAVFDRIRKAGLNAFAPLEEVDRHRLTYMLVFGGMTCVAAVAMLVSAMGITNTMLMSVLERTREIGIMKAVGASPRQLLCVFLIEGALVGLVGGGLGLLAAWGASFPGDAWVHSTIAGKFPIELEDELFVFPPWLLATVMAFALVVTTLASVYPARAPPASTRSPRCGTSKKLVVKRRRPVTVGLPGPVQRRGLSRFLLTRRG